MHILVASAFEASSQWAHAINTVKMAQGFSRVGHRVSIVCRSPLGGTVSHEELTKIYGLTANLHWIQLPQRILSFTVDEFWRFALLALAVTLRLKPDLIYARNYLFPAVTSILGMATIAESHSHPGNSTAPFLRFIRASRKRSFLLLITISKLLAEHYNSLGVPQEKLLVLPDAVDLHLFQRPRSLPASPYSSHGPHIVYTGHLYDYKGIPTILQAAALLPDAQFHMIGGWPEDIKKQEQYAQDLGLRNVRFYGMQPQSALPPFLWHADILLLPPSQHHPSAAWTSPLKLGEYLASGTPVIATDIVALRSLVTEKEVEFVPPDNPGALARAIHLLLADKQRSEQLITGALQKAQELSFEQRAKTILRAAGRGNPAVR
jgi:glycosyltransferase involved in cell wall biosynthesis